MKTKDFPEGFFEKPRRQATEEKGFDEKTCIPVTISLCAKWLWVDGVRCSKCNYKLQTTGLPSYCPNCGADMRGEE